MKYFIALLIVLFIGFITLAQEPTLVLPVGHSNSIQTVDMSQDGKYILSSSDDYVVILWQRNTAKVIKQFFFRENKINSVKFADEKSFFILFANAVLLKIDLESGKEILRIQCTESLNQFILVDNHLLLYYQKTFEGLGSLLFGSMPRESAIEVRNINTGALLKKVEGSFFLERNSISHGFLTSNSQQEILEYNEMLVLQKRFSAEKEIAKLTYAGTNILYATKDGAVYCISTNGSAKQILKLNDAPSVLQVGYHPDEFVVAAGKEFVVGHIRDSSFRYKIAFKSPIEDLFLSNERGDNICFILENGIVGVLDYKTQKGQYNKAHGGWNSKIIPIEKNEFLTYNDDNYFITWNEQPFAIANSFKNHAGSIQELYYNAHHNKIVSLSGNQRLGVYKPTELLPDNKSLFTRKVNHISPLYRDSMSLLSVENNKGLVFDFRSSGILDSFDIHQDSLQSNFTQSTNGQGLILFDDATIVQYIQKNNTVLFREEDGTIMYNLVLNGLTNAVASPGSIYLLLLGTTTAIFQKDATGDIELKRELDHHMEKVAFGNDDRTFLCTEVNETNSIKLFDLEKLSVTHIFPGQNPVLAFSEPNNKNQIVAITIDSLKIINLHTAKLEQTIPIDFGVLNSVCWKNDSLLILGGADGRVNFYNPFLQKWYYSFLFFDDEQQMVITNEHFYFGNQEKVKHLSYAKGTSIIGFEQLDIKYNRPDKVLEAIGNSDTALINAYKTAYEKRIKKLGIDTTQFKEVYGVPEAAVVNSKDIQYEQKNGTLKLHIKGNDSAYLLDRFNIWINDIPVYGDKGQSIRSRQMHAFDTTVYIQLSQGENRIETSILNVNGTESYRSPLFVKYTPAVPIQEKVHFIGIGINQFSNADYNLNWSVKDIRDLAHRLKEHYGKAISIDTLFDEKVTRENVVALKQHLLSLGEDDKVIVSYSGHGVLSKNLDYYLSTYNISFEQPETQGLPYDDLESLLDGIRPRKKLMFIDACHSGEVDKDEIARIETVVKKLDSNGISHKSKIKIVPKSKLGMSNSFELMQTLFVNVGKSTGATIISAAGGMQYAQERGDLKNGVFTYSILEAFNANNTLTVSQLKKMVGERVTSLTNGLQKPTSRNETINVDWQVW